MSQIRRDPITDRWVIIFDNVPATNFVVSKVSRDPEKRCAFCEGNEDQTPKEVYSIRKDGTAPDSPGWSVRVVPNMYPALRIEGELKRTGEGMFDKVSGIGAHEVIIESPVHSNSLAKLEKEHISKVLKAYRARIIDLKKDKRFKYILVFKNEGKDAGASLEHTHSQLIATPIVPKRVEDELEGAEFYYKFKERCIFCDIIKQELQEDERVIYRNEEFIAITPFAARFPFESWILPVKHSAYFENHNDQQLDLLADIFKKLLVSFDKFLDFPSYNFLLHNSPIIKDFNENAYHWHFEIIPKITKIQGFEWGTGFYINPVSPDFAAKSLKENIEEE